MVSKNLIKLVHSLEMKKNRRREGLFVAEGPKVVGDIMRRYSAVQFIATAQWAEEHKGELGADVAVATDDELRRASFLQHPQQVVALFRLPPDGEADATVAAQELCLALDGVQDPGNMGTILRVADWFGIGHVVCSHDTADAYSPKVVQATMGSIARVGVAYADLPRFIDSLPHGTPVYGTLLDGDDIYATPKQQRGLIVMGNEGKGLTAEVRARLTHKLLIPSFAPQPGAESLNVAIATAVVCSEFRREARGADAKAMQ